MRHPLCTIRAGRRLSALLLALLLAAPSTLSCRRISPSLPAGTAPAEPVNAGTPAAETVPSSDADTAEDAENQTDVEAPAPVAPELILRAEPGDPPAFPDDGKVRAAYAVNYGPAGKITGTTMKDVSDRMTKAEAVPNLGYRFVCWSDGSTDPVRQDNPDNVKENTVFTAYFDYDVLDMPVIAIDTVTGRDVQSKTEYILADFRICGTDDAWAVSETVQIRGRGNNSWGYEKKSYKMKFPEKVNLFDLGTGKDKVWVLLANVCDQSLQRNHVALELARHLEGIAFSPASLSAEVYLNGEYRGSYNLIEPVTDGRGRVEIDTENYDFIFEVDMNRSDGSYYFKPKHGQRMKVSRPEEVDSESRAVLKDFFDLMDKALMTHDMEEYSQYIDVDSFVDFYIHSEITKSIDVYDFSTRYFMKGGKLYAGPVWDYDLSMGNVSETCWEDKYFTYCNVRGFGTRSGDSAEGVWMDNYWFHELLKDPAFRARVLERFEELYPLFENLWTDNERGPCLIDWILSRYGKSFRRNYEQTGWQELGRYSGLAKDETLPFNEEVEWLRNWLKRRTAWVAFYLLDLTAED